MSSLIFIKYPSRMNVRLVFLAEENEENSLPIQTLQEKLLNTVKVERKHSHQEIWSLRDKGKTTAMTNI